MKDYVDPRMHTAEHILNQTMIRMFDCDRSFSSHIERKKSKCDYHFDRALADKEIKEIERQVNEVIQAALLVEEELMSLADAQKEYDLKRVPENVDHEIRVVRIGDYDACPCIGPHAVSTAEIGRFWIVSTSFENGTLRVRFKIAQREND
jgi:misacylated tRNA(Ala) deacylase